MRRQRCGREDAIERKGTGHVSLKGARIVWAKGVVFKWLDGECVVSTTGAGCIAARRILEIRNGGQTPCPLAILGRCGGHLDAWNSPEEIESSPTAIHNVTAAAGGECPGAWTLLMVMLVFPPIGRTRFGTHITISKLPQHTHGTVCTGSLATGWGYWGGWW